VERGPEAELTRTGGVLVGRRIAAGPPATAPPGERVLGRHDVRTRLAVGAPRVSCSVSGGRSSAGYTASFTGSLRSRFGPVALPVGGRAQSSAGDADAGPPALSHGPLRRRGTGPVVRRPGGVAPNDVDARRAPDECREPSSSAGSAEAQAAPPGLTRLRGLRRGSSGSAGSAGAQAAARVRDVTWDRPRRGSPALRRG
jgi:hypothetical protein